MNKLISIFIFSTFLFLFNQTSVAADSSWTILSQLTDMERRSFLFENFQASMERSINQRAPLMDDFYFTMRDMEGFGKSFTYLGFLEAQFLQHIANVESETNPQTIFFPGCGYGRSVLDALAQTKNTRMIANDFSLTATNKLREAQNHWFPNDTARLSIVPGDVFDMVQNLEDNSVDTIFCANLIHFFSPRELDDFFHEMNRVLKIDGKVFLIWEGHDETRVYKNLPADYQTLMSIMKKLSSANIGWPTYVMREDMPADFNRMPTTNAVLAYPHNYLKLVDAKTLVGNHEFALQSATTRIAWNIQQPAYVTEQSTGILKACTTRIAYKDQIVSDDEKELVCLPSFALEFTKANNDVDNNSYSKGFDVLQRRATIESHCCDSCHYFFDKLRACAGCKKINAQKPAHYCGAECQKADWLKHKPNCAPVVRK